MLDTVKTEQGRRQRRSVLRDGPKSCFLRNHKGKIEWDVMSENPSPRALPWGELGTGSLSHREPWLGFSRGDWNVSFLAIFDLRARLSAPYPGCSYRRLSCSTGALQHRTGRAVAGTRKPDPEPRFCHLLAL